MVLCALQKKNETIRAKIEKNIFTRSANER